MGAYLSQPMTEKVSEDGEGNGGIRFGASTMQGWRNTQEDAHNCVVEFDENTSLFGVYDGHGGSEVAIYVAKHFPDLLKSLESYKEGNIEKAFVQAYLKMDERLKEPEAQEELQRLAKIDGNDSKEAEADYEDENVSELYEEATMPLEKLVAKYKKALASAAGLRMDDSKESDEEKPGSSSKLLAGSPGSGSSSAVVTSTSSPSRSGSGSVGGSSTTKTEEKESTNSSPLKVVNGESSSAPGKPEAEQVKLGTDAAISTSADVKPDCNGEQKQGGKEEEQDVITSSNGNGVNGDVSSAKSKDDEKLEPEGDSKDSEIKEQEQTPTKPRKGKVHPVPVVITDQSPVRRSSPRKGNAVTAFEDDSDLDSSSGSDAAVESDSDMEEDLEEEDSESDEAGEDDDDDEDEDDKFLSDFQEPGYDSGTTAVVGFLRREGDKIKLCVANAGDSRCVISRNGTAFDMSYDHKPESEEEALRIVKAGGKVTEDGRVNGGLNLSRALGDHSYKQNSTLALEDQMISPLPSTKQIELDPKTDEFIVLACDGIWNSMSSQQVVDFVKQRIQKASSLSKICEELFDVCLADDTCGDGTGCDNMTAIVVKLSNSPLQPTPSASVKRGRGHDETEVDTTQEEESTKRPKMEVASE